MMTPEQHDVYAAKIAAGTMTYDDTADMFLLTTVGKSTGVTRADLLARLRQQYPDEQALNAWLRLAYGQAARLFPIHGGRLQ